MTALAAGPPLVGPDAVLRVRLEIAYRELAREREASDAARGELAAIRAETERLRRALGLAPMGPPERRTPRTMQP